MNFRSAALLIAATNIFLFAGVASAAPSPRGPTKRIYESAQGPIDIGLFEGVLSNRLQGSKVHIERIRWSHNPSDYPLYAITWYMRDATASYVVEFSINGVHHVQCDFILYEHLMQTMVKNCESTSARVDVGWFIAYVQIGLPVRGRPEDFRPAN